MRKAAIVVGLCYPEDMEPNVQSFYEMIEEECEVPDMDPRMATEVQFCTFEAIDE